MPGMQSVLNVIVNRAAKTGQSVSAVVLAPEQFSSMTTAGDPELGNGPNALHLPDWIAYLQAVTLASQAAAGALVDLTNGSTLYYDPKGIQTTATITLPTGATVPFPEGWNASVVRYQANIGDQLFFTET
jgi:hypothetical protein